MIWITVLTQCTVGSGAHKQVILYWITFKFEMGVTAVKLIIPNCKWKYKSIVSSSYICMPISLVHIISFILRSYFIYFGWQGLFPILVNLGWIIKSYILWGLHEPGFKASPIMHRQYWIGQ
jgi:hypothetical protein